VGCEPWRVPSFRDWWNRARALGLISRLMRRGLIWWIANCFGSVSTPRKRSAASDLEGSIRLRAAPVFLERDGRSIKSH
jgi:hypothetical protein